MLSEGSFRVKETVNRSSVTRWIFFLPAFRSTPPTSHICIRTKALSTSPIRSSLTYAPPCCDQAAWRALFETHSPVSTNKSNTEIPVRTLVSIQHRGRDCACTRRSPHPGGYNLMVSRSGGDRLRPKQPASRLDMLPRPVQSRGSRLLLRRPGWSCTRLVPDPRALEPRLSRLMVGRCTAPGNEPHPDHRY